CRGKHIVPERTPFFQFTLVAAERSEAALGVVSCIGAPIVALLRRATGAIWPRAFETLREEENVETQGTQRSQRETPRRKRRNFRRKSRPSLAPVVSCHCLPLRALCVLLVSTSSL